MGIFQGDVIIKAMVDLGLDDMRKNEWLLDHAFESLKIIPFIADKYGQSNIDAAKEWFAKNKVDVYMRPRNDKDILPCVTIYPAPSDEKPEMKTMGDASTETTILQPGTIGKSIPYVVKPFTPQGYSPSTGEVFVDNNLPGLDSVSPGMILVDPSTGNGYVIKAVEPDAIVIQEGQNIEASQFAVVPKFPYFKANVEHTFFQETYVIGCYAHGDPQALVWLWTITLYALLRYRESLLEGNGFTESIVKSGEIMEDPNYEGPDGEQAFVRFITITGQVENSWIKSPRRFIESVVLKEKVGSQSLSGIKVLSNLDAPPTVDKTQENWYTDAENEDDPNDPEDQDE